MAKGNKPHPKPKKIKDKPHRGKEPLTTKKGKERFGPRAMPNLGLPLRQTGRGGHRG